MTKSREHHGDDHKPPVGPAQTGRADERDVSLGELTSQPCGTAIACGEVTETLRFAGTAGILMWRCSWFAPRLRYKFRFQFKSKEC